MSKYLAFMEDTRNVAERKTKIIIISSKISGYILGKICWYSQWRQYAFYPYIGTIFTIECMNEISECIKDLMNERKNKG